ncbi:MAG: HAD family phosphatase [Chlamydiota bacterium]
MSKMENYDIIFFDFDGLLVNTEHLHYLAYQRMCLSRGKQLNWDFTKYCLVAHGSSEGLRKEIYADLQGLYEEEPNWAILYAEKKKAYQEIIQEGHVELMPGVELVLAFLKEKGIRSCVVTNSFFDQITEIRKQIPLLQTLDFWVTREDYPHPKPSPDPYIAAREKYTKPGDRILGFEDSVRGWQSLEAAGIEGVVISSCLHPFFQEKLTQKKVAQFSSFKEFLLS